MAGETHLTITGNLVADPELRFTASGAAVASFTVVANETRRDGDGNWSQFGEGLFQRCSAWRQLGENVAESFRKGDRVTVTGVLRSRSWTDADGNKRYSTELDVDDAAASVRFATVAVRRAARASQEQADPAARGAAHSAEREPVPA